MEKTGRLSKLPPGWAKLDELRRLEREGIEIPPNAKLRRLKRLEAALESSAIKGLRSSDQYKAAGYVDRRKMLAHRLLEVEPDLKWLRIADPFNSYSRLIGKLPRQEFEGELWGPLREEALRDAERMVDRAARLLGPLLGEINKIQAEENLRLPPARRKDFFE